MSKTKSKKVGKEGDKNSKNRILIHNNQLIIVPQNTSINIDSIETITYKFKFAPLFWVFSLLLFIFVLINFTSNLNMYIIIPILTIMLITGFLSKRHIISIVARNVDSIEFINRSNRPYKSLIKLLKQNPLFQGSILEHNKFVHFYSCILLIILIICSSYVGVQYTEGKHIKKIKTILHPIYDDLTYDKAFSSSLKNGTWNVFESNNNEKIAEFKGVFLEDNEEQDIIIQYALGENELIWKYMGINGVSQSGKTYMYYEDMFFHTIQ